jgi:large subunit ribosomal protein L13
MKLNKNNKTFLYKDDKDKKDWWLIDATDIPLGRLATKLADILRGKDRPYYTPFMDSGDFVVVVNAKQVKLTGRKAETKMYYRHSGYLGNLKEIPFADMIERHPDRVIMLAVKRMLPKNKLNRQILKKLKVFPGTEHKHKAQQPKLRSL